MLFSENLVNNKCPPQWKENHRKIKEKNSYLKEQELLLKTSSLQMKKKSLNKMFLDKQYNVNSCDGYLACGLDCTEK
jgi:hypothetical protein